MTKQSRAASSTPIHARVAIIGAGPSGVATALQLGRLGVDDVVLLDAADFPRDKTCGSGLSPRCITLLKELGVWERVSPMAYPISGLRLVTPRERDVYLSAGEEQQAVICLRRKLDHAMLAAATERGVRFVPNFRAREPITREGRWVGVRDRDSREVHADFVVVANGAHSKFTIDTRPKQMIHTIMGWWENVPYRANHLEMLFVPMVSPLYGWLFPESESRVNIGITYVDDHKQINARELFTRFLDRYYAPRLRHARQLGTWKGHPIVFSYRLGPLSSPGRVIVGEAGRMTHPATGEGIYQGMRSGVFAADALHRIVRRGADESESVAHYQRDCQRAFTASFLAGGAFRRLVCTPLLDALVGVGQSRLLQSAVAKLLAHI